MRWCWCWWMVFSGCTSPPPTGKLAATLNVSSSDTGELQIELRLSEPGIGPDGDATYTLTPSEGVRVVFRGQTIPLVRYADALSRPDCYAAFTPDPPVAAEEPITLTFDRGGSDRVTFGIDAPPDFTLSAPAMSPPPVTITWTPIAAEPMHWAAQNGEGPIPHDTGSIEFPPAVFAGGLIELSRTRTRGAETALAFAQASFTWTHDITVEVAP